MISSPITISLSPNAFARDVWQAFGLLLQPCRWRRGRAVERLEQVVAHDHQAADAVGFDSGRSAFYALLEAFGIGAGDEVIVQAFTCIVVPNSILWAGATPVFADVDASYNLDPEDVARKLTSRTRAIVVQHTFGVPADMARLQGLAQEKGVLLIEDCAHALGARWQDTDGAWHLAGAVGDGAFFSFGRDKVISAVFGGMAVARSPEVAQQLRQIQQRLSFPSMGWVAQQLFHPLAFALIKPLYFWQIGKALIVLLQKIGLLSKAVYTCERCGERPVSMPTRLPNAQAALALSQYRRLAAFNQRRREIVARYAAELPLSLPRQACPDQGEPIWLRYTLETEQAEAWLQQAQQHGMLLGDWYRWPVTPAPDDWARVGYRSGRCPSAERLAGRVVNLPTYPTLSDRQVSRVIDLVKSLYDKKSPLSR